MTTTDAVAAAAAAKQCITHSNERNAGELNAFAHENGKNWPAAAAAAADGVGSGRHRALVSNQIKSQ